MRIWWSKPWMLSFHGETGNFHDNCTLQRTTKGDNCDTREAFHCPVLALLCYCRTVFYIVGWWPFWTPSICIGQTTVYSQIAQQPVPNCSNNVQRASFRSSWATQWYSSCNSLWHTVSFLLVWSPRLCTRGVTRVSQLTCRPYVVIIKRVNGYITVILQCIFVYSFTIILG